MQRLGISSKTASSPIGRSGNRYKSFDISQRGQGYPQKHVSTDRLKLVEMNLYQEINRLTTSVLNLAVEQLTGNLAESASLLDSNNNQKYANHGLSLSQSSGSQSSSHRSPDQSILSTLSSASAATMPQSKLNTDMYGTFVRMLTLSPRGYKLVHFGQLQGMLADSSAFVLKNVVSFDPMRVNISMIIGLKPADIMALVKSKQQALDRESTNNEATSPPGPQLTTPGIVVIRSSCITELYAFAEASSNEGGDRSGYVPVTYQCIGGTNCLDDSQTAVGHRDAAENSNSSLSDGCHSLLTCSSASDQLVLTQAIEQTTFQAAAEKLLADIPVVTAEDKRAGNVCQKCRQPNGEQVDAVAINEEQQRFTFTSQLNKVDEQPEDEQEDEHVMATCDAQTIPRYIFDPAVVAVYRN